MIATTVPAKPKASKSTSETEGGDVGGVVGGGGEEGTRVPSLFLTSRVE